MIDPSKTSYHRYIPGLVLLLPILLLGGVCEMVPMSEPVDYSEIPGHYILNYGNQGRHELFVREDSSYIYRFTTPAGKILEDTSNWSYFLIREDARRLELMLDFFVGPGLDSLEIDNFGLARIQRPGKLMFLSFKKFYWGSDIRYRLGSTYGVAWVRVVPRATERKETGIDK